MVDIFVRIITRLIVSLNHLSVKILIYVIEFSVKTMEHVPFETTTDHTKLFASVDMAHGENIVN